jgi:hypothetical protein
MPVRPVEETLKLIFRKSEPNYATECIVWQGLATPKGYGYIKYGGKDRSIHRVIYEAKKGKIRDGLHVLHTCDNTRCVNKDHLYLGTNRENIDDKIKRDRSGKKLNKTKVLEIKLFLKEGMKQSVIARQFGVAPNIISRIKTGHRWAHLSSEEG